MALRQIPCGVTGLPETLARWSIEPSLLVRLPCRSPFEGPLIGGVSDRVPLFFGLPDFPGSLHITGTL